MIDRYDSEKVEIIISATRGKETTTRTFFSTPKTLLSSDFKFSLLLKTLFVTFGMLMNYCIVEIIIIPIKFCCHAWDSVVGGQCSFMCWTSTDLGYYSKYTKQVWISTNPSESHRVEWNQNHMFTHTHWMAGDRESIKAPQSSKLDLLRSSYRLARIFHFIDHFVQTTNTSSITTESPTYRWINALYSLSPCPFQSCR